MEHKPTAAEQAILDLLLERYRFEYVPIRLTATMLEKRIMDARAPLQLHLKRSGLVEYAAIGQGKEHKLLKELPFVTSEGAAAREVSFYRPATKEGDPRVWVARLARDARAGQLLAFAFSGTTVAVILVASDAEAVARHLQPYLDSRLEERAQVENTVRRLMKTLAPLASRWMPTKRRGPTGVGYTLETHLGIAANVSQLADVEGVELKAYRRGALTGGGKLVSLFAKTPDWEGGLERGQILRKFGYKDKASGRLQLYCTITRTRNTLGWHLEMLPGAERVVVSCKGERVCSYIFATLEKRLTEKHPSTLFVRASCRGRGTAEEFCYDEVIFCRQPSFANFLDLIAEDAVGLDFTLSTKPDGSTRDHGFLWRIRESRIADLYAYRRSLTPMD